MHNQESAAAATIGWKLLQLVRELDWLYSSWLGPLALRLWRSNWIAGQLVQLICNSCLVISTISSTTQEQ